MVIKDTLNNNGQRRPGSNSTGHFPLPTNRKMGKMICIDVNKKVSPMSSIFSIKETRHFSFNKLCYFLFIFFF